MSSLPHKTPTAGAFVSRWALKGARVDYIQYEPDEAERWGDSGFTLWTGEDTSPPQIDDFALICVHCVVDHLDVGEGLDLAMRAGEAWWTGEGWETPAPWPRRQVLSERLIDVLHTLVPIDRALPAATERHIESPQEGVTA